MFKGNNKDTQDDANTIILVSIRNLEHTSHLFLLFYCCRQTGKCLRERSLFKVFFKIIHLESLYPIIHLIKYQ